MNLPIEPVWRKIGRACLLAGCLIATGIAFLQSSAGQDVGSFDGTWEGKLRVVESTSNKDDPASLDRVNAAYSRSSVRVIIHGQQVRVYFGDREVKPGAFQIHIYLTNAVVFAQSKGEDQTGRWVETWNFSFTERSAETLIACFSRVVNNVDLPEGQNDSKFGVLATGNFQRTAH